MKLDQVTPEMTSITFFLVHSEACWPATRVQRLHALHRVDTLFVHCICMLCNTEGSNTTCSTSGTNSGGVLWL